MTRMMIGADDNDDYHLNAFAVVVVVDIKIFFALNCGLKCDKSRFDASL